MAEPTIEFRDLRVWTNGKERCYRGPWRVRADQPVCARRDGENWEIVNMAKQRLSYRRFWAIAGPLLLLAATAGFLAWILGGCVEKVADTITGIGADEFGFTPFDLSTGVTVPVTTEGADSPVTVITFAGAVPWGCGGLLLALWGWSKWQGRTTLGALDRVVRAIEKHDTEEWDRRTVSAIKGCVEAGDPDATQRINAPELLIRSRLKRLKQW